MDGYRREGSFTDRDGSRTSTEGPRTIRMLGRHMIALAMERGMPMKVMKDYLCLQSGYRSSLGCLCWRGRRRDERLRSNTVVCGLIDQARRRRVLLLSRVPRADGGGTGRGSKFSKSRRIPSFRRVCTAVQSLLHVWGRVGLAGDFLRSVV